MLQSRLIRSIDLCFNVFYVHFFGKFVSFSKFGKRKKNKNLQHHRLPQKNGSIGLALGLRNERRGTRCVFILPVNN